MFAKAFPDIYKRQKEAVKYVHEKFKTNLREAIQVNLLHF